MPKLYMPVRVHNKMAKTDGQCQKVSSHDVHCLPDQPLPPTDLEADGSLGVSGGTPVFIDQRQGRARRRLRAAARLADRAGSGAGFRRRPRADCSRNRSGRPIALAATGRRGRLSRCHAVDGADGHGAGQNEAGRDFRRRDARFPCPRQPSPPTGHDPRKRDRSIAGGVRSRRDRGDPAQGRRAGAPNLSRSGIATDDRYRRPDRSGAGHTGGQGCQRTRLQICAAAPIEICRPRASHSRRRDGSIRIPDLSRASYRCHASRSAAQAGDRGSRIAAATVPPRGGAARPRSRTHRHASPSGRSRLRPGSPRSPDLPLRPLALPGDFSRRDRLAGDRDPLSRRDGRVATGVADVRR